MAEETALKARKRADEAEKLRLELLAAQEAATAAAAQVRLKSSLVRVQASRLLSWGSVEQLNLSCGLAREVGAECCVAQSLDASSLRHKASQQTTQGSTIEVLKAVCLDAAYLQTALHLCPLGQTAWDAAAQRLAAVSQRQPEGIRRGCMFTTPLHPMLCLHSHSFGRRRAACRQHVLALLLSAGQGRCPGLQHPFVSLST